MAVAGADRLLDDVGRDWDLIGASVRKTNRVAIVEQAARGLSLLRAALARAKAVVRR